MRFDLDQHRQTLADLHSADAVHIDAVHDVVNKYVALVAMLEAELSASPTCLVGDECTEAVVVRLHHLVSLAAKEAFAAVAAAKRQLVHVEHTQRALAKAQAELVAHEEALASLPLPEIADTHCHVHAATQLAVHAATEFVDALKSELNAPPLDDVKVGWRLKRRRRIAQTRLAVFKAARRLAKLVDAVAEATKTNTAAAEEASCALPSRSSSRSPPLDGMRCALKCVLATVL